MALTDNKIVEKVSELKRSSGTPGGKLIPSGARWWLGLPLLALAALILARRETSES